MIEQGFQPNSITFISILSSCSHSVRVDEGRTLFDLMSRDYGVEPSVEHYACMVDLLCRAGHTREEMFCEVLDGLRRIMAMESSCDIDHEVEGLEGT